MVVAVILVILLAGLAVFLLGRSKAGRSDEEVAARGNLKEAQQELKDAKRAQAEVTKPLQGEVKKTERTRDKAVKAAKRRLDDLQDEKGKRLQSYRGVTLYERWIDTPHGSGSVAGATATVDSQISDRFTATRIVALGVFALAAKKKTGAHWLQIDGEEVASLVECPKKDDAEARKFALAITQAGKSAKSFLAQKPQLVAEAQQQLADAEALDAEVSTATQALDVALADESLLEPVNVAQAKVDEAEEALTAARGGKTGWDRNKIGGVAAAVLAVLIAVGALGSVDGEEESKEATPEPTAEPESEPAEDTASEPAEDQQVATPQEVKKAIEDHLSERASDGVIIAKTVDSVQVKKRVVTVVFDPEANGIDTDAMISTSPVENFAEFVGLPLGWTTEEAEYLRTGVKRVDTQLPDGTDLGSATTGDLYEIATGETLD